MNFSLVRLTFFSLKHLNIYLCGYHLGVVTEPSKDLLLKRCIKYSTLNLARKIGICHSLLGRNFEDESAEKEVKKKKKSRGEKVCVINENGVEVFMYLPEAEKYANSNNLTLVKLESRTEGRKKYELQRVKDVLQAEINKSDQSKIKQILIKEGISKHDLSIKINKMLKILEKETDLVCVVQTKDSNKGKEIFNELNTSKLQQYCAQQIPLGKGIRFHFKAKNVKAEENRKCEREG